MSASDWLERRILVSVGTGGVGKTTVSAALALAAAARGKRALVVTIDPAQRLADALGIGEVGHEVHQIPPAQLEKAGIRCSGSVSAMMLDTARTFDELVERYAPDPASKKRIFENPIYQNLTDAVSGSREYSALEKLYQLHESGDYDLIVLDTPPAVHALHFLDAPRRLTGFLDSSVLQALLRPAMAGLRLFRWGSDALVGAIRRVTGFEFLRLISDFLLAFETLWAGIAQRAQLIESLLRSTAAGFVLVVTPDPVQARRAREFAERLGDENIALAGLVLNRVCPWPADVSVPARPSDADVAALAERLGGASAAFPAQETAQRLWDFVVTQARRAEREQHVGAELGQALALERSQVRSVAELAGEVDALEALWEVVGYLEDGASRA